MSPTANRTVKPSTRPDRPAREPFAALPHSIAGRADVTPTEKAVLLALLFWARDKAVCWPSDRSIGSRIGRSVGTVQRALRRLEALGLVERRKVATNATGRELVLRWRSTPEAPARDPGQPPARDESAAHEKQEKSTTPRSGREATGAERTGKEPTRAELEAWAAGSDPILRKIGRAALAEAGEPATAEPPRAPSPAPAPMAAKSPTRPAGGTPRPSTAQPTSPRPPDAPRAAQRRRPAWLEAMARQIGAGG